MIRVLIVDDHQLVRQGLRALLRRADDIQIVGEARDGLEAIDMVPQLHPDVVTMDINMPRLDGLRATQRILLNQEKPRVLMVAMSWDKMVLQRAIDNGAQGFVCKADGYLDLIEAIHTVFDGKTYLSPMVQQQLASAAPKSP